MSRETEAQVAHKWNYSYGTFNVIVWDMILLHTHQLTKHEANQGWQYLEGVKILTLYNSGAPAI